MRQKVAWYWTVLERVLLILALIFAVAPVLIILTNSLKTGVEAFQIPPSLIFTPTLENYQYLLENDNFGRYFINSAIIAISSTAIVITFGTLAAYGLRLFRSRMGRRISNLLLVGRTVPTITILIPMYVLFNRAGLTGSHIAVILAHAASTMPFITWLIAGFMQDLPEELIDAATVDGCGRMQTLWHILFPILKPAIVSALILAMQYSWNEFLFSQSLTNMSTYTITVGVARYTGGMVVNYGRVGAVACISFVPIMLVGFFTQKYLVSGMTAGAVKG
ncbi:MAG TPA: carbohydrate ABC transporter permease [Candidatus Onthomonas avicola]|nr:carbohydrate ABC transporter permease [Candidatus Onthomonas avicola]